MSENIFENSIFPCDKCENNEEYLNGGECHCSKLEAE